MDASRQPPLLSLLFDVLDQGELLPLDIEFVWLRRVQCFSACLWWTLPSTGSKVENDGGIVLDRARCQRVAAGLIQTRFGALLKAIAK